MNIALIILGFLLFFASLTYLIVTLIIKRFNWMIFVGALVGSFILGFAGIVITIFEAPSAQQANVDPQEGKVKPEKVIKKSDGHNEEDDKTKAEKEAKAKAQQEAEEKAAAERKAKEEAERKALQEQLAKEKANKKANAQTIPYPQLKKNPDRYKGDYVKYSGEIIQILEGNGVTNIRLSVTKSSYGYDFNDLVFVEYPGYTDFVDGDIVTVYGEVYGSYTYESQAGFNITLPGILADEVTK